MTDQTDAPYRVDPRLYYGGIAAAVAVGLLTIALFVHQHFTKTENPAGEVTAGWLRVESEHFVTRWSGSDARQDLIELAERTRARSIAMLTRNRGFDSRLRIYFCRDAMEVGRIETEVRYRYPWASRTDTEGGFYSHVPMIVIQLGPGGPELDETVSHEVVHWVCSGLGFDPPPALDEGLATYISERLTAGTSGSASWESWENYHSRMNREARKRAGQGELPSLREMISMDDESFYGDSRGLNYYLGMCVAAVLVESFEPEIRGNLPAYLEATPDSDDAWKVFCRFYPEERVAELWRLRFDQVSANR